MSDTPMTREPRKRDGMEPDTYVTLDCGHTALRYNNLRSDPVGWQTHCDVCNATRTVTASRPREPNPTPMTREQAWETARQALDACDGFCGDSFAGLDSLAFLRTEMERLEGERDRWRADADLGNDLQRRDEARIEELETLIVSGDTEDDLRVARIAELEAALRELVEAVTADGSHDAVVERVDAAIRRARAALPDTAGPMTDCTRCGRPIADDGQPWCDHAVYLPDTEGEQDG